MNTSIKPVWTTGLVPNPATLYALDVTEGRTVAGPHVRDACKRHLADLKRDDIYFDLDEAYRVWSFFTKQLHLSEGQFDGKPFILHPSQEFILLSIFGWKRTHDGARRFRRGYIEEGKGNGKTPLFAGIGLYGMFADREPGAQVYSAASTKGQADLMFQDAVKMAKMNSKMWDRITPSGKTHVWNMAVLGIPQAASFFRPVARTVSKRGSGPRPHFVLVDELHELGDRGVLETLERGFKFRRQPLLLMITNSGHDRKSVCWEERKLAVRAARGERVADEVFSYICALDKDDDPLEDPSCWIKANPLLGTILTEDYLASVVSNAQTMPSKLNGILRLHFCVWTESEDAWITRTAWEAIEDPDLTMESMEGRACRAGMDLSSRKDLSAVAYAFDDGVVWDEDEEKFKKKLAVVIDAYTPEVGLTQRARTDGAPYDVWVRQGFLKTTPGPVIRFPFIIRDLVDMQGRCDLQSVAYDAHLIVRFQEDVDEAGADLPLIEHPQGWNRRKENPLWMPGSIDLTEDMILEGRLRVHVNPVLRAAVSGATFIRSPADLKRFSKNDATQRIDALIALVQAVGAWHIDEAVSEESVYEALARKAAERDDTRPVSVVDDFGDFDD